MKVWSTFSSVGGLDLGLARAGYSHTLFAESDPWRRLVLAAHYPGVPIFEDVREVGDASDAALPDLLCGGFPCQDLSVAGRRRGLAGARSGLFHEFARIADAVRPRWILLENVPGLLSSNDGRDMGVVVGTLAELGYGVGWRVLDARYFGVPQRRRRVFIVGHLGGEPGSALRPLCESCEGGSATLDCSWQVAPAGTAPGAGDPGGRPAKSLTKRHAGSNTSRDGASDNLVASTLQKAGGDRGWRMDAEGAAGGHLVARPLLSHHGRISPDIETFVPEIGSTLKGQRGKGGGGIGPEETLIPTAFHQTQDPISSEDVTPALGRTTIGMGVGFRKAQKAHDPDDSERWEQDDQSGTLTTADVGIPASTAIVSARVRRLTPTECERLMGWPDGYTAPSGVKAPDSKRYAACGDGVVANVAEWIGRRIQEEDAR